MFHKQECNITNNRFFLYIYSICPDKSEKYVYCLWFDFQILVFNCQLYPPPFSKEIQFNMELLFQLRELVIKYSMLLDQRNINI